MHLGPPIEPNPRIVGFERPTTSIGRAIGARFRSAILSVDHSVIVYGAVALPIVVTVSPALFFSFGYHNDYQQWAYDSYSCCMQYPETNMLIDIGRYFGAFAQNLQAFTIHSLDDLWWWRLIGILSVARLASDHLHIVSPPRPPRRR